MNPVPARSDRMNYRSTSCPSLHSWPPFSALMVTHLHSWSPFSTPMVTLLCTHGHPSLHSWSPFSTPMVTLLCTHGHPSLHPWSPFSTLEDGLHRCTLAYQMTCMWMPVWCMRGCAYVLLSIHHSQFLIASYCWNARAPVTPRWEETLVLDVHIYGIPHHLVMLIPMMNMEFYDIDRVVSRSVVVFAVCYMCVHYELISCCHGHPSLHPWSPFSALMVTLLCTHGHPSLHPWSPFSTPMVTLLYTHGHPSLYSWSPFSTPMVTLLYTHGHPSLHSWLPFSALMATLLCILCIHVI